MKAVHFSLAALFVAATSCWSGQNTTNDNIISAALRLRLAAIAPVVIDPQVLDIQLLSTEISVNGSSRSSAVADLKQALEPQGLLVSDQGEEVWITKQDVEVDLSPQIALVVKTADYKQLAALLNQRRGQRSDARISALAEMAEFMARQSELPAKTRKFVGDKSKKIKSLQYMQKNALSGSALSAPEPARAATLEMDIDKQRDEVRQYFNELADRFLASNFNPSEPSSAPPAVFGVEKIIPAVLFNRIALDSQLFFAESMEVLLRESTELAFNSEKDQELASALRVRIDAIKKLQTENRTLLAEYIQLLERAGLLSGSGARGATSRNVIGVDAANRLFNDFGDQRESVRLAIGENIMGQLEAITKDVQAGRAHLLAGNGDSQLYLFGGEEIAFAQEQLGVGASFVPYSLENHQRVGAVTGLTVRGDTAGETSTFSIELERRSAATPPGKRSLENIFGSSDEIVEINTTADVALVDGIFLGKTGAYSGQPAGDDPEAVGEWIDKLLGGSGTIASVGEALTLIKNKYDPALFKSKIVLSFDSNFQINYGGDSAGVAIALATLSRIKAKAVDSRLMVSGAVRQFGDVRAVGGVYLKGKAALDAGALVLLMPESVLGDVMNLPTQKVLGRHVVTMKQFRDAASISSLDTTKASREPLESVCLYNFALAALKAEKPSEALSLSLAAVRTFPNHISAQLLKAVLVASGISAVEQSSTDNLIKQAKAFSNIMTTNPIAARDASGKNIPADISLLMATVIPDYTISNASGEEAFDVLSDKAKAAGGQPANITIRTKNEFFTKSFINLSMQDKTFQEILKELCSLCDAKFQKSESSIVIDSIRPSITEEQITSSDSTETTSGLKSALTGATKAQVRSHFGGRTPDSTTGEDIWAYGGSWSDSDSGVVFKKAIFFFSSDRVRDVSFIH